MIELPQCEFRYKDGASNRCGLPNVRCNNQDCVVPDWVCQRCKLPRLREISNGTTSETLSRIKTCRHRGDSLRNPDGSAVTYLCPTCCDGEKKLKVYACSMHGETHAKKCSECADYVALVP